MPLTPVFISNSNLALFFSRVPPDVRESCLLVFGSDPETLFGKGDAKYDAFLREKDEAGRLHLLRPPGWRPGTGSDLSQLADFFESHGFPRLALDLEFYESNLFSDNLLPEAQRRFEKPSDKKELLKQMERNFKEAVTGAGRGGTDPGPLLEMIHLLDPGLYPILKETGLQNCIASQAAFTKEDAEIELLQRSLLERQQRMAMIDHALEQREEERRKLEEEKTLLREERHRILKREEEVEALRVIEEEENYQRERELIEQRERAAAELEEILAGLSDAEREVFLQDMEELEGLEGKLEVIEDRLEDRRKGVHDMVDECNSILDKQRRDRAAVEADADRVRAEVKSEQGKLWEIDIVDVHQRWALEQSQLIARNKANEEARLKREDRERQRRSLTADEQRNLDHLPAEKQDDILDDLLEIAALKAKLKASPRAKPRGAAGTDPIAP